MQETEITQNGLRADGSSFVSARDELVDQVGPSRAYVGRSDIPAPPVQAKTQAPRRMRWVKIPSSVEFGYGDWMIYMWTSFPGELLTRLGDADDSEKASIINQIFIQHNGWTDEHKNPIPQPGDDVPEGSPDFWGAIPQEVANALIQLMNVEQRQLSFLVKDRPGTSRRS